MHVHVGFVVDKVTVEQISEYFAFPLSSSHQYKMFIHSWGHRILESGGVGKQHENQHGEDFRDICTLWILPSSQLLRDVSWFKADVSGLPIGPIFKGHAVQEEAWPLMMRTIGRLETSVLNRFTPRNNSEDGRIDFNSGGVLRSCVIKYG